MFLDHGSEHSFGAGIEDIVFDGLEG